jgi:hypothetical protein
MRRKSVLLTLGILVVLLGAAGTGLTLLVRHEPRFYREKAVPPGQLRRMQSQAFQQQFLQLATDIKSQRKTWQASFTEAQINSYFEEHFIQSGVAKKLLPEGVSAPRVALDPDGVRLAFRYGCLPWSTIISIDFRVWLTKDPNVVALELKGLHAGSLPISAQSLLEQISDFTQRSNKIEVTWYRHGANPVALLRFLSERPQPTVQLQRLTIHDGVLSLSGGSTDHTLRIGGVCPSPAELPPAAN